MKFFPISLNSYNQLYIFLRRLILIIFIDSLLIPRSEGNKVRVKNSDVSSKKKPTWININAEVEEGGLMIKPAKRE